MRKILEERLENARNDYGKTTREPQLELKGQIEAYQDCLNLLPEDLGELSDGYHTFNSLYEQRMYLFATIVKQNKNLCWKSYKHEDGELCFGGGWFIVGIDTPKGSYTYHYENKYWDLFDCQELERGKHWDGHTDKDVIRLLSITSARTEQEILKEFEKLGYKILDNNKNDLILVKDMGLRLMINKELKHYMVVALTPLVTMQEHKLLNELFECYGFLED